MKIIGLMACRNEDWVLGLSARAALMWLDELVIGLHACDDASELIAIDVELEHPDRVTIIDFTDPVWHEMQHRQSMLETARMRGATHVVYIDADEVLTGNMLSGQQQIRGLIELTPQNCVLQVPWLQLRGSIGQVHVKGPWADNQVASLEFRDAPELHWSSSQRGGYDFHHREPMGGRLVPWKPLIAYRNSGLMHLQFVSGRRLRAKQALYKLTEILRWPGREPNQIHAVNQRYNLAVYGCYDPTPGWQERMALSLGPAPVAEWWDAYARLMKYFKPHTIPWQEAECLKLLNEHGPQKFAGLDLFGIGETVAHQR